MLVNVDLLLILALWSYMIRDEEVNKKKKVQKLIRILCEESLHCKNINRLFEDRMHICYGSSLWFGFNFFFLNQTDRY